MHYHSQKQLEKSYNINKLCHSLPRVYVSGNSSCLLPDIDNTKTPVMLPCATVYMLQTKEKNARQASYSRSSGLFDGLVFAGLSIVDGPLTPGAN